MGMGTAKPLGLASAGISLVAGLIEYYADAQIWVTITAMIGACLLILAVCSWYWQLEISSKRVKYDWSAQQAYEYAQNKSVWGKAHNTEGWENEFRQHARNGSLTVFGRHPKTSFEEDINPIIPIKKEYWDNYEIDMTTVLQNDGRGARTRPSRQLATDDPYEDIRLSKFQSMALWKPRPFYARLCFRWPIYLGD